MNRGKGYIVRGAGTGLTGGTSVIRNATFTGVQIMGYSSNHSRSWKK
jgi:hypothetical protein